VNVVDLDIVCSRYL